MFPYTVKYTESESDIQNNDLLHKIEQNAKMFSNFWKTKNGKFEMLKKQDFILLHV